MLDNILALVAATVILIAIPGPNVALIVAISLKHGYRYGLVTVLGTTLGMGLQLVFVISGFAVLIDMAAGALGWIRWLGVGYLVYLGAGTWGEPAADLNGVRAAKKKNALLRGIGLAVVNPKTLLFNAAFLPQFVGQATHVTTQLVILSSIFLVTVAVGDSLWVGLAAAGRASCNGIGRLQNRLAGGFLMGAGIGLALARRSV